MKLLTVLSLTTCLLISACTTAPKAANWPENIPSRDYFAQYYAKDTAHQEVLSKQEYLTWIYRFYFGWELYERGWLKVTDELLATLPSPTEKQLAREKMHTIGRLVAPEWAKDSNHRVINTRHMSIWGVTLTESISQNEQLMMLDKVMADVQGLLAYQIQPKEIDYDRYYNDQDDPF